MPEIEVLDEDEYAKSTELAEHYEDARSELAVQISEAKNRKESFKGLSERLGELESSLEVWEAVQHRKSLFEAMKAAYGPKGLKIHQLKKICNAICKTLPKYTTVMFQEPRIEFFVDNDPDSTEIEFYIRRFLKTGTEEYPVGKLSGGEKKRLAVAFIFSLADLVAPRKKCNLIVLDEVGDGLDPVGEYAFASQLLPQLTQESVIITSHRPGIESAQFDSHWSVTKIDHRSTFSG
jgi:DNA repair exonuclease SbcCD ATPase subunit